jgi:hypothetical protein
MKNLAMQCIDWRAIVSALCAAKALEIPDFFPQFRAFLGGSHGVWVDKNWCFADIVGV